MINTNAKWFRSGLAARAAAIEARDTVVEEAKAAVSAGDSDAAGKVAEAIRLARVAATECYKFANLAFENQTRRGYSLTVATLYANHMTACDVTIAMEKLQQSLGEAVSE